MIGLSISLCVPEIASGEVNIDDVTKIVAGTACRDTKAWERVIRRYRDYYWQSNPDRCEEILKELLVAGKIAQPRLIENRAPSLINPDGHGYRHWVSDESEIQWFPRI